MVILSFDKAHFIQFHNESKCTSATEIRYEDERISIANETKFVGLFINNNNYLSWKTSIEIIKNELSSACYVMRLVKPYVTANILKMIYYGLILCGKSEYSPDTIKIIGLQKKII